MGSGAASALGRGDKNSGTAIFSFQVFMTGGDLGIPVGNIGSMFLNPSLILSRGFL